MLMALAVTSLIRHEIRMIDAKIAKSMLVSFYQNEMSNPQLQTNFEHLLGCSYAAILHDVQSPGHWSET